MCREMANSNEGQFVVGDCTHWLTVYASKLLMTRAVCDALPDPFAILGVYLPRVSATTGPMSSAR